MYKTERCQTTGFYTYYPDGTIEKSLAVYLEYGNFITLYFRNGRTERVQIPLTYPLEPYQLQFGITVSLPFRSLFVQSWEGGLCCVNIDSSEILWKIPLKHAYEVYALEESVYVHFVDDGLYRFDIRTGQYVKRFPYTTGGVCFLLTKCGFFIGPIRGKYQILDFEFCKRYSVPVETLNPDRCESFLIHGVELADGQLSVSGLEEQSTICGAKKFKRQVLLENFGK